MLNKNTPGVKKVRGQSEAALQIGTVLLKGNVALARHFYARVSNARRSCLAILAYVTCIKSASVE